MAREKIPCTVAILTKNNASTLPRALKGLENFEEIIVCDGGSTDETLNISVLAGAKILVQDASYLAPDGRIDNFAGVRNQMLEASTQPWFFFLDSDEHMNDSLVREIRKICETKEEGAYWVPRKYVCGNEIVECAAAYPNKSMRFFAHVSVTGFIKIIHERIALKKGVIPCRIKAPLSVPVNPDVTSGRRKGNRYIRLQIAQAGNFDLGTLWHVTYRTMLSSAAYILRMANTRVFCRGVRMPLYHELEDLYYNVRLIAAFWKVYIGSVFKRVQGIIIKLQ